MHIRGVCHVYSAPRRHELTLTTVPHPVMDLGSSVPLGGYMYRLLRL